MKTNRISCQSIPLLSTYRTHLPHMYPQYIRASTCTVRSRGDNHWRTYTHTVSDS